MSRLSHGIEEGAADLPAILRDVRVLVQRGAFPIASRRFGELRLEDGRHHRLEQAALESPGKKDAAVLRRLAASRTRLLQLESVCASALERCDRTEYEATADALEQELVAHTALERSLERRVKAERGRAMETKEMKNLFQYARAQAVEGLKKLVQAASVRHLRVRDPNGKLLVELPFSVTVLGAFIAPVWASAALLAGVATGHTIDVKRTDVEGEGPAVARTSEKEREIHASH